MPSILSRKRVWIPLAVLGLVASAGLAAWIPARPAIAFLRAMEGGPQPTEASLSGILVRQPGDPARGRPRSLAFAPLAAPAPVLVLVGGLTPDGIEDPRVWRFAMAFRDAGFAVLVPQLVQLERPGESEDGVPAVLGALAAAARGDVPGGDGRHIGLVGVSLGGAVVLRAAAHDPPPGLRALLLVGVPDDVRGLAADWFHRPSLETPGRGPDALAVEAALFARHAILRAALPSLVPPEEIAPLRRYVDDVGDHPAGTSSHAPPAALSDASRRWTSALRAEEGITSADLAWGREGAAASLTAMSPASFDGELSGLRAAAYLLHGTGDPLVPIAEMDLLAARLARRTTVRTLSSTMIAHVSVATPGILEGWRHVRFVSAFFDAVKDGS